MSLNGIGLQKQLENSSACACTGWLHPGGKGIDSLQHDHKDLFVTLNDGF